MPPIRHCLPLALPRECPVQPSQQPDAATLAAVTVGPPRTFEALVATLIARQDRLSRRNIDVARFFLNHPEEVAIATISRLAESAQVTPAAVTRFAQKLRFAGFPDLQRVFCERLPRPRPAMPNRSPAWVARPRASRTAIWTIRPGSLASLSGRR